MVVLLVKETAESRSMITFSYGIFHSVPNSFFKEQDRARLKSAGFRFHWGKEAKPGKGTCSGSSSCVGCKVDCPPLSWVAASHVEAKNVWDLLDDTAKLQVTVAQQAVADSRASAGDIWIPVPEGLEYFPYQKAAIQYATQRNCVLFGDEMGLGKTQEALGLANAHHRLINILVVCPASLKLNWKREAEKWLVHQRKTYVIVDNEPAPLDATLVIVNYERLLKPSLLQSLARQWDLLILDEAHRIKTGSARRSVAILDKDVGLAWKAKRVAMLTGTPLPNRPRELYPLLKALDPIAFDNQWQFLHRYCGPTKKSFYKAGGLKEAWDFDGSSNLEELQELMRSRVMVRRLKKDVLKELPPKIRKVVPFEATSTVKKNLAKLSDQVVDYEKAMDILTAPEGGFGLPQIAKLRKLVAMSKLPATTTYIQQILDDGCGKLVVFAHHQEVVEKLTDNLNQLGLKTVMVYGPMTEKARMASVDAFQADPGVRVLVGSIQAAGVGLTLTAASKMVFVETSWSPGDITQCEDRIHRVGQTRGVIIEHLIFDESVEAYMVEKVLAKQRVLDAALDTE